MRTPDVSGSAVKHQFKPRFKRSEISKFAALYDYPGEAELIFGAVARSRSRGYLTRDDFLEIAEWKSARPRKHYQANQSSYIEEVSRLAFAPSTSSRLAIELLTLLNGVSWPTASVFLHFCHSNAYPILDYRALWSLSVPVPRAYTYSFWEQYCAYTRAMARDADVDMRTLDRALWKYSQLHQPGA